MVHSMTAFARTERAGTHGTLSWELRSVNHRYLEPQLRLPEAFRDLEGSVRDALRQGLSRGKVECTLRFTEESTGKALQLDRERAAQLISAAESIASLIKQPAPLNPLEVLAWPGVLVADGTDPQAQNAEAMQLFNQALDELKNGRGREGAELAKLLDDLLIAGGTLVEVHGHTDNQGPVQANMTLSEERAFAVKTWLEKTAPSNFPSGRVKVFAHGQSEPLESNASAGSRAKNRRVEIVMGVQ